MALKGLTLHQPRLGQPPLRAEPAGGAAVAVPGAHLVPGGRRAALRHPHAARRPAHAQMEDRRLGNEGGAEWRQI